MSTLQSHYGLSLACKKMESAASNYPSRKRRKGQRWSNVTKVTLDECRNDNDELYLIFKFPPCEIFTSIIDAFIYLLLKFLKDNFLLFLMLFYTIEHKIPEK